MNIKEFKKPGRGDIEDLSLAVAEYTRQLSPNAMLKGTEIKNVVINTTAEIPHLLGQDWKGYIITDKNSSASIFTTNKSNRQLTLNLSSTAAVTVDVWVY